MIKPTLTNVLAKAEAVNRMQDAYNALIADFQTIQNLDKRKKDLLDDDN